MLTDEIGSADVLPAHTAISLLPTRQETFIALENSFIVADSRRVQSRRGPDTSFEDVYGSKRRLSGEESESTEARFGSTAAVGKP